MAAAAQSSAGTQQNPIVRPSLEAAASRYGSDAAWGVAITAVCTILNPIGGAAVGAYCIVDIGTSVALDVVGCSRHSLAARVTSSALGVIFGLGAAIGVLSLLGVTLTFSPILIGCGLSFFAMSLLATISNFARELEESSSRLNSQPRGV